MTERVDRTSPGDALVLEPKPDARRRRDMLPGSRAQLPDLVGGEDVRVAATLIGDQVRYTLVVKDQGSHFANQREIERVAGDMEVVPEEIGHAHVQLAGPGARELNRAAAKRRRRVARGW